MDRILTAIEQAYERDPFRIKDIINHVNDNQIASKTWLLENLRPEGRGVVLGGWYGYLASELGFTSVDVDPGTKRYGQIIYPEVDFRIEDCWNHIMKRRYQTYVCTSCEHMPQEDLDMVSLMPGLWALQSNNYHDIPQHINCKDSLAEFRDEYNWDEILYEGELDRGHYKRWMVIGLIK